MASPMTASDMITTADVASFAAGADGSFDQVAMPCASQSPTSDAPRIATRGQQAALRASGSTVVGEPVGSTSSLTDPIDMTPPRVVMLCQQASSTGPSLRPQ